ncbi:hypothetical protein [Zooshikella ganghwensis]|uniref:hypothetical protein n=1 Tax=Zooshikella ganghwensis TaxID=202772 RepID=UPI0012F7C20D|nr:hypothetical protein [Zooshikella ganghwensis]
MLKTEYLAVIFCVIFVAGCAGLPNFSNLKSGYKLSGKDAIVVMGVFPRYRIGVQPGHFKNGKWERDEMKFLAANIFPENGYIVTKLSPLSDDGAYVIDQVLPEGIGAYTPRFVACNGTSMVAFNSIEGRVIYVGDFEFYSASEVLRYAHDFNLIKAKESLSKHYPSLAEALELATVTKTTTSREWCI